MNADLVTSAMRTVLAKEWAAPARSPQSLLSNEGWQMQIWSKGGCRQAERATVFLSDQRQKEWNNWLLGEGPLPFTGERAVRANDRRRGDLTFLEGGKSATNNPSRFVGGRRDATANRSHLRSYRPGHRSRKRYLCFKSRGDLELIKVTLRL